LDFMYEMKFDQVLGQQQDWVYATQGAGFAEGGKSEVGGHIPNDDTIHKQYALDYIQTADGART